jgi:hypothetical protein
LPFLFTQKKIQMKQNLFQALFDFVGLKPAEFSRRTGVPVTDISDCREMPVRTWAAARPARRSMSFTRVEDIADRLGLQICVTFKPKNDGLED